MLIREFELSVEKTFKMETPRHFKPIHVGEQDGKLYVWAEVDTNSETFKRTFHCVCTGESDFANSAEHLGSVVESNTPFVWHFYWYPKRFFA